jgi:ribosome-binding protein aMBF1 (putative translation factor)
MGAQIVEIAGQKIAMLPIADYERLLELAEDSADILAARRAEERRLNGEEYVPSELVKRILAGERPLRVWREYRGLSLAQLSAQVGIGVSYLSEIERGLRQGPARIWVRLARALDVTVEDILPDDEGD